MIHEQIPNRPTTIGIVGGVASGKSAVTNWFLERGATVVSADRIGHEVLEVPDVIERLVERLGTTVLEPSTSIDGGNARIDRKKMASLVFGDTADHLDRRRFLESIVHPRIRERAKSMIEHARREASMPWIVLDAPLLIEGGWLPFCDRVIFIESSEDSRRDRALTRGWTEAQWLAREKAQLPLAEKRSMSTDIVENNGTLDDLYRQLSATLKTW